MWNKEKRSARRNGNANSRRATGSVCGHTFRRNCPSCYAPGSHDGVWGEGGCRCCGPWAARLDEEIARRRAKLREQKAAALRSAQRAVAGLKRAHAARGDVELWRVVVNDGFSFQQLSSRQRKEARLSAGERFMPPREPALHYSTRRPVLVEEEAEALQELWERTEHDPACRAAVCGVPERLDRWSKVPVSADVMQGKSKYQSLRHMRPRKMDEMHTFVGRAGAREKGLIRKGRARSYMTLPVPRETLEGTEEHGHYTGATVFGLPCLGMHLPQTRAQLLPEESATTIAWNGVTMYNTPDAAWHAFARKEGFPPRADAVYLTTKELLLLLHHHFMEEACPDDALEHIYSLPTQCELDASRTPHNGRSKSCMSTTARNRCLRRPALGGNQPYGCGADTINGRNRCRMRSNVLASIVEEEMEVFSGRWDEGDHPLFVEHDRDCWYGDDCLDYEDSADEHNYEHEYEYQCDVEDDNDQAEGEGKDAQGVDAGVPTVDGVASHNDDVATAAPAASRQTTTESWDMCELESRASGEDFVILESSSATCPSA